MLKLSIFLGFIIGISHFEGGLVTLFWEDSVRYKLLHILEPFSAGALLSLSIIYLIPQAFSSYIWAPIIMLISISLLMVLAEFGKPNRFFVFSPNWGQMLLLLIYSFSLGILVSLGISTDLHLAIIGTIIALPVQFIQAVKGFIYKTSYPEKRRYVQSLLISSLIVPLTILIMNKIYIYLNPDAKGALFAILSGVFLFQGILAFQVRHPYKSVIPKILYLVLGLLFVCLF